jgi:hypothetical protein
LVPCRISRIVNAFLVGFSMNFESNHTYCGKIHQIFAALAPKSI